MWRHGLRGVYAAMTLVYFAWLGDSFNHPVSVAWLMVTAVMVAFLGMSLAAAMGLRSIIGVFAAAGGALGGAQVGTMAFGRIPQFTFGGMLAGLTLWLLLGEGWLTPRTTTASQRSAPRGRASDLETAATIFGASLVLGISAITIQRIVNDLPTLDAKREALALIGLSAAVGACVAAPYLIVWMGKPHENLPSAANRRDDNLQSDAI